MRRHAQWRKIRQHASDKGKSQWLLKYSTLIALVILFLGFALTVDRFLTTSNLLNIVQQISM